MERVTTITIGTKKKKEQIPCKGKSIFLKAGLVLSKWFRLTGLESEGIATSL